MSDLSFYDTLIYSLGPLVLGIYMLIKGGNKTVTASVAVARQYGISPMIVGFTIVAFGTSLPELVVSVFANFEGVVGIALGNVIGSNIANMLLVIGVCSFFVVFIPVRGFELIRDLSLMLGATVFLAGLMVFGAIPRWAGGIMVFTLLAYVFVQCWKAIGQNEEAVHHGVDQQDAEQAYSSQFRMYVSLVFGLVLVIAGAEFLVKGATLFAELIGVPEAVIGLSIIAVGTSLPELSTSIVAARQGYQGIVIGNILGSNVFNILMILGVTSLVKPFAEGSFAPQLAQFDIWFALAVSIIFSFMLLVVGKIGKKTGFVFLLTYVLYNIYIYGTNIG